MDKSKHRKSYKREFKLEVLRWHENNGRVIAHTAHKFEVDRKCIREWINKAESIREEKRASKKTGRKSFYPVAENELYENLLSLRSEGKSVKRW